MIWLFKKPKGTGALLDNRPEEEKQKDYRFEEIVAQADPVNWVEKPQSQWRKFPIFDQGNSNSCVAFSLAKILGILHYIKEGEFITFSAGFIYQQRSNKPAPGMIAIDAWEIVRKNGALLEELFPSQGKSDAELDSYPVKNYEKEIAKIFAISNYVVMPIGDIDVIASTIQKTGKGIMVWYFWKYEEWDRPVPEIKYPDLTVTSPGVARHSVCFTPDTMVLTINGYKPISEIKVGDLVLTHKNRFRRVTKIFKREYSGDIIVFKAKNSIGEIKATPDHPILKREINIKTQHLKNTINQGLDKFNFEPAETITINSVFVNGIFPSKEINFDINEKKAYLLGAYIGDGNLKSNEYAIRFALGGTKKEEILQKKLIEYMHSEFGVFPRYYKVKNQNSFQLIFRSKEAYNFFAEWGGTPHNKRIKKELIFCDKKILSSFLDGIIDTDGSLSIRKRPGIKTTICKRFFTAEKNLAYDFKLILDKLELNYSIVICKPRTVKIKNRIVKCKGGYDFSIYINPKNKHIKYKDGFQLIRCKYVKKEKYSGIVYNLEVEEDNTYIVDGVIVHNCAVDFTLYKGKKALIIEDSWGKNRGINGQRVITEDFHKARNFFAAYPINFRFEELPEKPRWVFNRDLYYGMKNDKDVEMLQRCLAYLKLFPNEGRFTGNFFGLTLKAVKEFQKQYGLPQTGYVGPETRKKLNELFGQ